MPRSQPTADAPPRAPFRIPVRVYFQDTDAGGVVFHAQFFAFMERARSEFLNAAGLDLARFGEAHGVLFVVHTIEAKFRAPAKLNEMLSVSADAARISAAGLVFRQRVERGTDLLVEADVHLALVDRRRLKPVRLPEELRTILARGSALP